MYDHINGVIISKELTSDVDFVDDYLPIEMVLPYSPSILVSNFEYTIHSSVTHIKTMTSNFNFLTHHIGDMYYKLSYVRCDSIIQFFVSDIIADMYSKCDQQTILTDGVFYKITMDALNTRPLSEEKILYENTQLAELQFWGVSITGARNSNSFVGRQII